MRAFWHLLLPCCILVCLFSCLLAHLYRLLIITFSPSKENRQTAASSEAGRVTKKKKKEQCCYSPPPCYHADTIAFLPHSTAKIEDLNTLQGRSSFCSQKLVRLASPLQQPATKTTTGNTGTVLHMLVSLLGSNVLSNNISRNVFKGLFLIWLMQHDWDRGWRERKSHSVHSQNVARSKECQLELKTVKYF